jgi:hypothetical protein
MPSSSTCGSRLSADVLPRPREDLTELPSKVVELSKFLDAMRAQYPRNYALTATLAFTLECCLWPQAVVASAWRADGYGQSQSVLRSASRMRSRSGVRARFD